MKRKKRLGRLLAAALIVLMVVYVLANAIAIWVFGGRDETQQADVAIVLGASTTDASVSPVYAARLDHAVTLYREGYVQALIVTGGVPQGRTRSDAAIAKDYAVSQGVPAADVWTEDTSTITRENLENAKAIMDAQGFRSALVVSDPLHMRRAMLLTKAAGIRGHSSPTTTSRYVTPRTQLPFLAREVLLYIGYKWHLPGG